MYFCAARLPLRSVAANAPAGSSRCGLARAVGAAVFACATDDISLGLSARLDERQFARAGGARRALWQATRSVRVFAGAHRRARSIGLERARSHGPSNRVAGDRDKTAISRACCARVDRSCSCGDLSHPAGTQPRATRNGTRVWRVSSCVLRRFRSCSARRLRDGRARPELSWQGSLRSWRAVTAALGVCRSRAKACTRNSTLDSVDRTYIFRHLWFAHDRTRPRCAGT